MSKPLFEHRHFVWLAKFAAQHLTDKQSVALTTALAATNPHFDVGRFESAICGAIDRNWRDQDRVNDFRGLEPH